MANDERCPFCRSDQIRYVPRASKYDYEKVYCDGCKTEMTYYPPHIATVWNRRTETDGEHCPLCGGEVEFDGLMNYSTLFADAYCPTCRVKWEFQRASLTSPKGGERDANAIKKARKAFGRRA